MANTKITQHVIADDAITTAMITDANITPAKLHGTLDLSSKTLTIPAVAIPSASTATTQSAADNSTKVATTAYVETAISNLVDSSPSSLNTLNELAAALNDDASFSSTVTASIATKLPLAGGTMTGAIAMGTSKITGLGDPTANQDAGTKTYIDTADALKLNLSGGTLTGDLILNTTTALRIPAGTTGERPTAATAQLRWNTSDGALEVYNGSAWTAVGTGSSNKILDTFTGDNSTTDFTLSVTPANEDALMVFIDGVYQEKGDYVLTNAVLALNTAPASGEKIAVHITTASVHDGTSAVNQQFTATAGQTAFTLSADPKSENNTQVYINGVYQQKTDYTVSGTTLTFDTGLTVGDVVEVNAFTVSTLGNTDTMAEGTTNLYHTTARARSAISVSGNALSYNSSTGVITSAYEETPTFTGTVTAPLVDAAILDGENFKINGGQGSDGQVITSTGSGVAWEDVPSSTPATYDVDFLVIAGGGAGTDNNAGGGGGGAGGYRSSWNSETSGGGSSSEPSYKVTEGTAYNITVGAGGVAAAISGQSADQSYAYKGTDSVFGTIRSLAGGASQKWGAYPEWLHGGSGCGGTRDYIRGNGTTGQGYNGGAGSNSNGFPGGGGGGAGALGGDYASYDAGDGGAGLASTITGSSVTRGGGGGGGSYYEDTHPSYVGPGNAGTGGGGRGTTNASRTNVNGTANTGGGAGGGGNRRGGGNGGSGVVILRMPTSNYSGTTAGSPTVTTSGSDTILTFNSSGSYTA